MQYAFGEWIETLDQATARNLLARARHHQRKFAQVPLHVILEILDKVSEGWRKDGPWFTKAQKILEEELALSPQAISDSLDLIPTLCSRESILSRVRAEFADAGVLDGFTSVRHFDGRVRAVPHGILLHVSAGNIFLGAVDSLIAGFVTKNVSILRLSARNQKFPELFAQSVVEADQEGILASSFALVHWSRTDKTLEAIFKENVSAILAWGGEEMVKSYRQGLPASSILIEHGPKISFSVITAAGLAQHGLKKVARDISADVCRWDQSACASPQNLFIEAGIDASDFMNALEEAFSAVPTPRGRLDDDEEVEMLKEEYRALFTSLTEGGILKKGRDYLLHFDPNPGLRPAALNRNLIVKSFKDSDDLVSQIAVYRDVLQSCGYVFSDSERDHWLNILSLSGVKRFARVGQLLDGMLGAPHDGRYPLKELVQFVADENSQPDGWVQKINRWIKEVPFYGELYRGHTVSSFSDLIPLRSSDLTSGTTLSERLLAGHQSEGHIFSSGGTSGAPKFAFFTDDDLDRVAELLARGLKAQGLKAGTLCANLFAAGNLWSSFMAIDRALTKCQARQLGLGGTADAHFILKTLADFKPQVVLGLPSLLVDLATKSRAWSYPVHIPRICYAGEHLSVQARQLLASQWGTENFFSAGYASVDAGPIGYQCSYCKGHEHHLFEDTVHLEIIDGEGLVTSKVRQAMPVIHLRTGDHLEWLEVSSHHETDRSAEVPTSICPCGSRERKFVLHGRMDGQINIWSCRIQLEEVEAALNASGLKEPVYQLELQERTTGTLSEILRVNIETESPAQISNVEFAQSLHAASKDLRNTHPTTVIIPRIELNWLEPGRLERIARTGKIRRVIDLRR